MKEKEYFSLYLGFQEYNMLYLQHINSCKDFDINLEVSFFLGDEYSYLHSSKIKDYLIECKKACVTYPKTMLERVIATDEDQIKKRGYNFIFEINDSTEDIIKNIQEIIDLKEII